MRLQEYLHTSPRWARSALAALSLVGLIGLVAASGCINGESIEPPPHDGFVADDSIKAAIPGAGDVLIAGGADASNRSLATAEFFDPSAGQFVATGGAASSRAGASAASLSATQGMLDGGFSGAAAIKNFSLTLTGYVLSGAEIFDEVTGAFSPAGRMAVARMGSTATTLRNGKILVVGGQDNLGDVLDTAELYDPAVRKFIAANNTMSDRRMFHTATILLSGKVLVVGGAPNLSGDTTIYSLIY